MTFAAALIAIGGFSGIVTALFTLSILRDGPSPDTPAQLGAVSADATAFGRDTPSPGSPKIVASEASDAPSRTPAKATTVALAEKPAAKVQPIASVSGFTIADAVEITFGKPSNVAFRLEPERARLEPLIVNFEGLPQGTGIYGLTRLGDNSWRLQPSLSHAMLMLVPPDAPKEFAIRMRLQRDDGSLVALRTVRVLAKP